MADMNIGVPAYQRENCGKHYECRFGWHDDYVVMAHLHRFSEWLYVESGVMTMYVDGAYQKVEAGQAVLIMPDVVHAYTAKTANHALCVVCSNDFIPCLSETRGEKRPMSVVFDAGEVAWAFSAISKTKASDHVRFMALLNTVADAFLRQTTLVSQTKVHGKRPYREVLTYIDEHYREDISLNTVATALGYHAKYLSSVIGSMSNINFRTLLASRRVECACALLRESEEHLPIAEIAYAAGFSSINTFNRTFKMFCGKTPREYRNEE